MAATVQAPVTAAQVSMAATPPVGPAAASGGFVNASLYVGDLDQNVNEGQLLDMFSQVAQVHSIRVCRDQTRRVSLGYAYVNFGNPQDAATALEVLNFAPINGKPMRIMLANRDPSSRKSGYANVFIKNLDTSIDNKALHDTFAAFGTVLSCKVAVDGTGQSKGYGFVQFETEESAKNAIKRLNGMLINDKQVYVGNFVRHQERNQSNGSPKFTNVFVKNLPETTTDDDLKNIFAVHGEITSAVVMKDSNGNSRCFGFVNFQEPDSASAAVEKLNGTTLGDDRVLYVGRAQRKSEREAELKAKFEQERLSRYEKLQGANLYIKNLDDNINDESLKELFSEYGTVTSCKVMVDLHGLSKGSGFVAFSTPEEAARALNEMNGKIIGRKPLYVAVAQRKEERKARLQAQFAQIRAGGMTTLPSGIPGFHPGTPRLAPQQLYFGQGTPGLIPPQPAGYGFQQQLLPGMRPGIAPNYIMPYQFPRQGQTGPRAGMRRVGNSQQVQQQQQLMLRNSGQGFRYMNNARNGIEPPVIPQGLVGPMMPPLAFDTSGVTTSPIDIQRRAAVPTSTLASALASATPENQRLMLGEQLYPLVERLEPSHAAKVTGMLLEMDQPEVLHLIESPDDLKNKVAEAMEVLRKASTEPELSDQLSSLGLKQQVNQN